MEKDYTLGEVISVLKKDVTRLAEVKLQQAKLEAVEKGSSGISGLIFGIILLMLINGILLFGFLALGFLLADYVNSMAGGFALVGAFYLILLLVMYLCRKPLLNWVTGLFIKEFDPDLMRQAEREYRRMEQMEREEEYYGCK